jgi:hypothetical protein
MPDPFNIAGAAPTPQEMWRMLQHVNTRLSAIEHKQSYVTTAFPTNDLDKPDYDGHRKSHLELIEQNKVINSYKTEATKKVLAVVITFVATLILAALIEYFARRSLPLLP